MMTMDEWEINKPLGQCCGTGERIEPGQEYYAALVESEEGLQRRDFCTEYWQSEKPNVFCYWKSKLPRPDEKKRIFVDDEMLMAFFERLAEETQQEKINFRFVLTLILMRKKRLKYDSSRRQASSDRSASRCGEIKDNKEVWRLKKVGETEFVEVINPHLDEEQIGQLASQLSQILQVEL